MIASTLALSRPSEKFGTHSTSVDITEEDNGPSSWRARLALAEEVACEIGRASVLSSAQKLANSQPHLHGVYSRIRRGQTRVRNVHVPKFEADIFSFAEDVHAQCSLIHEVDGVCSGGYVMAGEKSPSGQLKIG